MNKIKTRKKFVLLLDKDNDWIEKYLSEFKKNLLKNYKYIISKKPKEIKNKIVFVISYTKLLKDEFIKQNEDVLIIHPSKLPKDKGFSPVQNQILRNKKRIYITMIKANKEIDSGPICFQESFILKGDEIYDEIRFKQAEATVKILKKYINKYPKIKFKKQKGKTTYNYRRRFKDNELNINQSIKSQFNLLRIVNNDLYPANFKYKNSHYILKIFKKNN